MVHPAFYIERDDANAEVCLQSILLMEVSVRSFSYIIFQPVTQDLFAAKHYLFSGNQNKEYAIHLAEIIDNDVLLQHSFKQVIIAYNFHESTMIPETMFHIHHSTGIIELLYGNVQQGLIFTEKMEIHAAYNIYRVPTEIHAVFQQKFAANRYCHFNTLWLNSIHKPESTQDNTIDIVFYADQMLVSFIRHKQLCLNKVFLYQSPQDVVYHLLNCCTQFNIQPKEVQINIAGYVEENSILFEEIKKYFLHITLDTLPSNLSKISFSPHPTHFFSHLLKIAVCV